MFCKVRFFKNWFQTLSFYFFVLFCSSFFVWLGFFVCFCCGFVVVVVVFVFFGGWGEGGGGSFGAS